jgi:hypothetical protein
MTGFKEQASDMTKRYTKEVIGSSSPHFEPAQAAINKIPDMYAPEEKLAKRRR